MEKSIIDQWIYEQINFYGHKHILFRYQTMYAKIDKLISEMKNQRDASNVSDIKEILGQIINGIKEVNTAID